MFIDGLISYPDFELLEKIFISRSKIIYNTLKLMNKQNKKILDWLHNEDAHSKWPSVPRNYIPTYGRTDKDTNGLTACIVDFLNLSGHQAERISSTGRFIDTTQVVTDVVGFKITVGTKKMIKGAGKKGTADISATINALSVKIEVKFGKDRQSQDQKAYEQQVNKAGGIYFIAKTFDQFMDWYYANFIFGKEIMTSESGINFIVISQDRKIIQRTDYFKIYELTKKQFDRYCQNRTPNP